MWLAKKVQGMDLPAWPAAKIDVAADTVQVANKNGRGNGEKNQQEPS